MKYRMGVWTTIIGVGLWATIGRADDKPREVEIARPIAAQPTTQPTLQAPDNRCAEPSRWTRVWEWLSYRTPRSSYCRGLMFGSHGHHPPIYTYFLPAPCHNGPTTTPVRYQPETLPGPRTITTNQMAEKPPDAVRVPAHVFEEKR